MNAANPGMPEPLREPSDEALREALRGVLPEGTNVAVELVWDLPWTPERMSPEARRRFDWSGA